MNDLIAAGTQDTIRPLRGEKFLRQLHHILPLGRKYHPLVSLFNRPDGFIEIPFGIYKLVYPAAWRKSLANHLLVGADVIPEFRLLLAPICSQLHKGCLVDVGANIGLYTLLMRANSKLPIIAFEPQPFLCDLIRRGVEHNRLAEVEVRNVGCGAERGEAPFYTGTNGSVALEANAPAGTAPANLINVPIRTLDEELAGISEIALLKIDCEGFEFNILQGARKLIARHKPHLFIEIHPAELEKFGHSARMVVEFLRPNYEMEFWCFHPPRRNHLAQSLAKFRKPAGLRYENESQMLDAVKAEPRPSQVYCIGRPR
jgi:FkbM family methyltransferase